MKYPYQDAIAWVILESLEALGGEAKRKDVIKAVTNHFMNIKKLTEEDVQSNEPCGKNVWEHRVDSIRAQMLVPKWLDPNASSGTWNLTPAAWAGFFTIRAFDLSEKLEYSVQRLEQLSDKAEGWLQLNRTEMVQKIKEVAELLIASDKVGEIPDFAYFRDSYRMWSKSGDSKDIMNEATEFIR